MVTALLPKLRDLVERERAIEDTARHGVRLTVAFGR